MSSNLAIELANAQRETSFVSPRSGGGGGGGGSLAIENCKGHVHIMGEAGSGGRSAGFYKLSPGIPESGDSKVLLLGIPLGFQEIVQPTVTLDDKRTLYIFGSAWNDISVMGMLLLGEASTKGAQLSKLLAWYDENRVSKLKGPIRVSLGTSGVNAYVVGLRLEQANAQFNTQMFSIQLLTAETAS